MVSHVPQSQDLQSSLEHLYKKETLMTSYGESELAVDLSPVDHLILKGTLNTNG
jgi:hypothetical protein